MFSDPRDLFKAAQAAIAREDWRGLAEMCDSASLRLFQLQTLRSLEPRDIPTISVEEYRKHDPDMPRAVAEYHVSRIGLGTGPEARLKEDFPTFGSVAELANLPPVDLFTAWLQSKSLRTQLEGALREEHVSRKVADRIRQDMPEQISFAPPILLAVVPDGDRIAHLLYRSDRPNEPDPSIIEREVRELQRDMLERGFVQVETVRRSEGSGWGLIAEWGMMGLGHYAMFFEPADDDSEAV